MLRQHILALALGLLAAAWLPGAGGRNAAVAVGDVLLEPQQHVAGPFIARALEAAPAALLGEQPQHDGPFITRAVEAAAPESEAAGAGKKAVAGEEEGAKKEETATELVAEAQDELSRDAELVTSVAAEIDSLSSLYKRVFEEGNGVGAAPSAGVGGKAPLHQQAKQEQERQQQRDREELKAEIARIQQSLATLMGNLNETQRDLTQAHEAMAQEKTLEDLEALVKQGKLVTDYETGELNAPAALGDLTASLAAAAAAKAEDKAAEEEKAASDGGAPAGAKGGGRREAVVDDGGKGGRPVGAVGGKSPLGKGTDASSNSSTSGGGASGAQSASTATTTTATREQEVAAAVEKLQAAADPARLHLDVALLRDVVLMSVFTALGGFAATVARLPAATGYMAAGMLIGPSGLNLIQNLVQVETLAQFGSIFLLFGHGLMYCQHYGGALALGSSLGLPTGGGAAGGGATGAGGAGAAAAAGAAALAHSLSDTFVAGVLILSAIFFMTILAFTLLAGGAHFYQATLVASAVALSSTTTTAHALVANRLRETAYGKALIELMAVQDLLMAPLLSIPTAVKELLYEYGVVYMLPILFLYGGALAAAALLSKRLIPKIINLRNRGEQSLSLDLFILGIVSYCLLMSLLTEWMGLSHEAGALLAGLILADVPNVGKAVAVIEPLTCVFGGMYLSSLGMLLSPVFLVHHAGLILGCVLAVLVIKVTAVAVGMRMMGFSAKASLLGGLSLAQISELSLFLVARAHEYRLISRRTYLLVVATTVVLLMLTPISASAFRHVDRSEYRLGGGSAAAVGVGGAKGALPRLDGELYGFNKSSGEDKDFDAGLGGGDDGVGGVGVGTSVSKSGRSKTPVGKSVTHRIGQGRGGGWGGGRGSADEEALLVEMA